MADQGFDLFGDAIPDGFTGRGRPPHMPDQKKRFKVMLLLALEKTEDDIAAAIGITAKTLRKHYSRELRVRAEARLRLDGELLATLAAEAAKGNVGAIKEFNRQIEKHDHVRLAKAVAHRPGRPAPEPRVGKKEGAKVAARKVAGIYAPPPQPRLVN